MRASLKYLVGLLLPVLAVCACSPQKSLAHRLARADRVVATNLPDGLSITLTGKEMNKFVQAVAAGQVERPFVAATAYLQFEFYKGGEHLETIPTALRVFWIGDKVYSDPTGALEAITLRYREEHPSWAR